MDLATSSLWPGTIYERISIAGQLLEAAGHGLLPQKVIWDDVGILWDNFYNFALIWSNMNLGTLGLSGHRPRQCMTFALLNHFASPFVSLCVGWVQYLLWVLFQTTFNVPPQIETGTMCHHKQGQAQTEYGSLTGLQGGIQFVRRIYVVLVEVVYIRFDT